MKLSWEHLLARQLQRQPATRPGMTRFPAYRDIPVERALAQPGVTPHAAFSSRRWVPGASSCWLQVLTWTRGEPYPWRANGSPMCADSRAAKTPTGFLTSHLSRTRARDGEGVTDRQFRASTISSRLSLVRGGLFSSLGKRACVLLPDLGIGCRVVDGGRPIGEKGLVHAP